MSVKYAGGPPPQSRSAARGRSKNASPAIRASFSCASYGEIVVLERGDRRTGYLVAWRRDGRFRRSLTVLKRVRDHVRAISSAAALADCYVPPAATAPNRLRDSQRMSVYAWENRLRQGRRLSSDSLRALSDRICAHFGVRPVMVRTDGRLHGSSFFSPFSGIVIANGMNDEATLWHEVAHYLTWKMSVREAPHGPAFVATLIAIRWLFGRQPYAAALASARAEGIEVNEDLFAGLIGWQAAVSAA